MNQFCYATMDDDDDDVGGVLSSVKNRVFILLFIYKKPPKTRLRIVSSDANEAIFHY